MNRAGLYTALVIGLVTGVVFALYPQLDIALSRLFFQDGAGFALTSSTLFNALRDGSMVIVGIIVALPIGAAILKLLRPETRMLMPGRAAVFLIATILLGPLLTANIGFKDNWSRPRPRDVAAFGGTQVFVPWWDPRGTCEVNCSFIGGEAAGAYWTMAPAALAPPQWRALAYGAALAFGTAVSLLRMAFGGHFFSDVVFAGVFIYLIIWLAYAILYRWRLFGLSDATIERAIASAGRWLRRLFRGKPRPRTGAARRRDARS
jgi:membrane-associated PAP2 superfamily phosphatase